MARPGQPRAHIFRRVEVEHLEDRAVPSMFTVSNLNDNGSGSLRQAILDANSAAGNNLINFASGVSGAINLVTPLPDLSSNIDLEGPAPANVTVQCGIYGNLRIFTVTNGATVTIAGLTVSHDLGPNAFAGIQNQNGTLTVSNCALDTNYGVGIGSYAGEDLTVSNCTFTNKQGGGILIAAPAVGPGGVVTVSNCTLSTWGPAISSQGGTLNVSRCNISNNTPGISNSGTLDVSNSTISSNSGGGIYNTGTATIDSCTIAGNTNMNGGGGISNSGTLTITNSTVTGNSALGRWEWVLLGYSNHLPIYGFAPETPAVGGGIWNSGTLTVNNCTIAANTATQNVGNDASNGGGIASTAGTVTVHNTIIAQNQSPTGPDVVGTFVSQGHNLIGNGSGSTGFTAPGDQVSTPSAPIDPRLGPLQNNGGPTQTMALLRGSPAIDAGDNNSAPATDQRGFSRLVDPLVDIGAFDVRYVQLRGVRDAALQGRAGPARRADRP
jgi:hypothetical protein